MLANKYYLSIIFYQSSQLQITQIMTFNINKSLYLPLFLIVFALAGCENNSAQLEQLTQEKEELAENYQNQLIEAKAATQKADSLHTVVNHLEAEVQKLKGEMPVYNASNDDEKAIETLVNNLHQGWANMLQNDDTKELLKYFLPQYTTSTVRVNTDNIPSVDRKNNSNFEQHIQELMLAEEVTVSFGQTKFLYTEVKGNFFVTSYRTRIRVYQKNKEVYTSSLVTLLAGEKKDEWKVGSYNWVTFNY